MRNFYKKATAIMFGMAVISGGGFIRAAQTEVSPFSRGAKTGNIAERCTKMAREAMVLKKKTEIRPFRAAAQELVLEEDFSLIKGGSESNPGAELGNYSATGDSFWDNSLTHTPGWWGLGTYAMDGAVGLCYPNYGGVVSSGPMNMYGNLHVSFRAKAREGNDVGKPQALFISITKGDSENPIQSSIDGAKQVNLKVEDGWQDIELTFRNPNTGDDSRLQINGRTISKAGFVIDDIKITRDYEFCTPPTQIYCRDFTNDGFTLTWDPGAENNSFLFSLIKEKKTSEAFDGVETFEGAMPQYWSTSGELISGEGVEGTRALKLTEGKDVIFSFGGGRLGDLKVFVKKSTLAEDSKASLKVLGRVGDQEIELATIDVTQIATDGADVNLRMTFSDDLYVMEGIRLLAEGFGEGEYCLIDNVDYLASPACERSQVMLDEPVADPMIKLTDLDPEDEYYAAITGVKDENIKSDMFGYYYIPGMPTPEVNAATEIEKRGAYTANWGPSAKAQKYTVTNYAISDIAEDTDNYVVLRDDFKKADNAVQVALTGSSFDDWTDCKGWHVDGIPDNFMTMAVVDAGTIGAMFLNLYTPQVSLNNNGGKFTLRFHVKAWGDEMLTVYSNGKAQKFSFLEQNPAGDPYQMYEYDVEMNFDNGTEKQSIIFSPQSYSFFLDWVEIVQDVKAGDRVVRYQDSAVLEGRDSTSHRFTGLQNSEDVAYGYDVTAHGEYMGTSFSSMPSELEIVNLNTTGDDTVDAGRSWVTVGTVAKGVVAGLSESAIVEVFTLSGMRAAIMKAEPGETVIELPAGPYIVRVGNRNFKVIVR